MFGLFKKSESPERKIAREEFEKIISGLRRSKDIVQISAGYGLNMAHSIFLKKHQSIQEFCKLSHSEKISYIQALNNFEETMSKQDGIAAIGISLFKMWICSVVAGDDELSKQISAELLYFSKKGEALRT